MSSRRTLFASLVVLLLSALVAPAAALAAGPNVLLVGPAGTPGAQYTSIQAAVNAAQPGDWVLVAPGVYHEKGFTPTNLAPSNFDPGHPKPAAVYITTPNLHLRGMNRDTVIIDGTNLSATQASGTLPAGSPACSSDPALQDPGVKDTGNTVHPREGILVFKTSGVSIENLAVCNSLENEIWWNQGDGTGDQRPMALFGDYITGTSTFYSTAANAPSAQYGIFTSDEEGPALIDHSYANNMTDSSYYIGACRNCNTVLERAHAEFSALGLSSTNAGGNFIVENGEWDNNRTGLVSNAQNNDDFPSPEYGQCVTPSTPPPGAGPNSCYVIRNNYIHDNNNPNTPGTGLTAVSAIGSGVELAATQHVSVVNNRIENNGSWGVITHDLPDPESGPAMCRGGNDIPAVPNVSPEVCYFFSRGNHVANNRFLGNGSYGNVTNGDIANQSSGAGATSDPENSAQFDPNCFATNTNNGSSTVTEWPADLPPGTGLQEAPCPPGRFDSTVLLGQLVCATGADSLFSNGAVTTPCPEGAVYPQRDLSKCTGANMVAMPSADDPNGVCFAKLSYTLSPSVSPPMPDPCAGVPANAYCPSTATAPSPTPSILPLTSAAVPASLPAALLVIAAIAGLLPLALGRRRSHPRS